MISRVEKWRLLLFAGALLMFSGTLERLQSGEFSALFAIGLALVAAGMIRRKRELRRAEQEDPRP